APGWGGRLRIRGRGIPPVSGLVRGEEGGQVVGGHAPVVVVVGAGAAGDVVGRELVEVVDGDRAVVGHVGALGVVGAAAVDRALLGPVDLNEVVRHGKGRGGVEEAVDHDLDIQRVP